MSYRNWKKFQICQWTVNEFSQIYKSDKSGKTKISQNLPKLRNLPQYSQMLSFQKLPNIMSLAKTTIVSNMYIKSVKFEESQQKLLHLSCLPNSHIYQTCQNFQLPTPTLNKSKQSNIQIVLPNLQNNCQIKEKNAKYVKINYNYQIQPKLQVQ